MQLLWAILVLFSLSNIAHGQTPSEAEPTVEALLIQANSKRDLAYQKIDQLPNRVEGEVARLMARLDRLFQDEMQERFNEHDKQVEQSLQTVSLPGDERNVDVAWKQYKAALGYPNDLNDLVKDFIHRAGNKIKPLREELAKDIDSSLTAELKQAQDTIRAPFQEILRRVARHLGS